MIDLMRRTPIEQRKRTLAKLVRRPHAGIVLNEVFEGDGDVSSPSNSIRSNAISTAGGGSLTRTLTRPDYDERPRSSSALA